MLPLPLIHTCPEGLVRGFRDWAGRGACVCMYICALGTTQDSDLLPILLTCDGNKKSA